jgi:PAS domain S-box-containing protein
VAESLTGWANAEVVGQPVDAVFRIVNEQTRQPVENPARRALREGVIVGLANHTILIRKDGTERSIDDSAAPIRCKEDQIVGCVLVFRDVTERRGLEKQTIEQADAARKLAAIVGSSEDAIISKTLNGIIQSWNAAAERIFGYAAEEAVGRPITMLFPADRLDEEEKIISRIRCGERVAHFDTVRLRKDGSAIPISLTISPIKDGEGRIIGASKIARDITERKRLEDELRRVAAELSDADRQKDEFLAEMAGPLNEVVKSARKQGVFIIHAPSSVTAFYKDTPQRKRAQEVPFAKTPVALSTSERWGTMWCWPDPKREPDLPIDDSDMGCDCAVKCKIREAWTRQIATIEIAAEDAITDNGQETWNLLAARGIDNVILCGVHLNMCVLGRPFAIRQMVHLGKHVVLMRDLTDTMYNPEKAPRVSHFAGTDLVIAHVEKYWCPSITSTDISGRPAFRFKDAK